MDRDFNDEDALAAEYEARHVRAQEALELLQWALPGHEYQTLDDLCRTESARRTLLMQISIEEFADIVAAVNGVLRGLPAEEWGFDGRGVVIGSPDRPSWDFAEHEDKGLLLEKTLSAARKMAADGRDLRDIGLLVSCALTAIHLFSDGNGRTARFLLALICQGSSDKGGALINDILVSNEFSNGTNANIIQGLVCACIERKIGKIQEGKRFRFSSENDPSELVFLPSVSESTRREFTRMYKKSRIFLHRALFIYARDRLPVYQDEYGEVDARRIIADLDEETLITVRKLWQQQKRTQVEVIIDTFVHDQAPQYRIEVGRVGEKRPMSILEYYKTKIAVSTDEDLFRRVFE